MVFIFQAYFTLYNGPSSFLFRLSFAAFCMWENRAPTISCLVDGEPSSH